MKESAGEVGGYSHSPAPHSVVQLILACGSQSAVDLQEDYH